jgi:transcriptional regulator with XRE-family HTH domain
MNIGNRLKYYAKDHYGSIRELVKTLDVNESQFSRYLSGTYIPNGEILVKLAKLGCDINWLLTGEITDNLKIIQENKELREKLETIKKVIDNGE